MHLPGLSRSGSALRKPSEAQTCLGWACALCPSQALVAQEFGERRRCDCGLPLLLSFLGVPLAFLLRRMMTVQNPQKS